MVLILYAALLLATLSFFLLRAQLRHQNIVTNPPPGPKPWPIIGNLNLVGPLPHRSFHQLSQKYGPLMQLHFGSFPVVIGSSVEMSKIFLKTMDVNFCSRPKTAAGKYINYNSSDITWAPYGSYWKQLRKWCATEMFNAKRIESYEFIRREEILTLVKKVYAASGNEIIIKGYLSTLSLNVISRMVLGKNYLVDTVRSNEFKEMIEEWFVLNGVLNIGDLIPWIDFLDLQGYVKRMKILHNKFDKFLEHVLDEHNERRQKQQNYVANDMVDVLLQLADDPTLEVKIERHGVKAFALDLLAGGTDTSAIVVEWAISELLMQPEIFEKATEELDRVIGRGRWIEENDIQNLPYIQAIAKETMRLHPVAPVLGPREALKDCKIGDYDIVKGTRIHINVWTIGRDPALWEEPDKFVPERFIAKNIDVKGTDFELLPFGAGRRMCPGYPLGLKVIESSLANLLHGFNWKLPDSIKKEDLNMEEVFGLSVPKKIPLVTVPEARLPLQLY